MGSTLGTPEDEVVAIAAAPEKRFLNMIRKGGILCRRTLDQVSAARVTLCQS